MNDIKEMIRVVTDYIMQSKGVRVNIKPPTNSVELKKLTNAYNVALSKMK